MNRRMQALLLTACLLATATVTLAQVTVEQNLTDEQLWTDAIYYLKIGRMEYGKAYLQGYVDRKVDPVKTLEFSETDPRSVQILIRLQEDPQIGPLARAVLDQIDKGWLARRRDIPRIKGEIERLTGTVRAQVEATERLKDAGEYAVPVMLEYLADPERPALHAKIIDALAAMGTSAVEPLLAAVLELPEPQQLLVLRALGRLNYPQEIPYLKELIENSKNTPAIRTGAANALEGILTRNPKYRTDANAAIAYYQLALRYYYRDSAVRPAAESARVANLSSDVAADQPNIWFLKEGKLVPQAVPWEIYYELMTMRLTRRSLQLDTVEGYRAALTLWLMADCKRESRLSATVVDPIHPQDFPAMAYFYRTAGTRYCLDALAKSLADGDVVISVAALEALRDVASGNDILAAFDGSQPIVSALTHQHQMVRTYAALALGWTAPSDKYPGMDQVVGLLGQALAGPKHPTAVVILADGAKRQNLAAAAKSAGFGVKEAANYDAVSKFMTENPADVELIVLDFGMTKPGADQAVARIRENSFLRLVPIVVLAGAERQADASLVVGQQPGVAVMAENAAPEALTAKIEYLRRQMGRFAPSKEQAAGNALLAAEALEKLARVRLAQYNVEQARENLVGAMNQAEWTLARQSARVLSLLASEAAQKAIADAAMARKETDQKVTYLNFLGESIRQFGGKLSAGQVKSLQELAIAETDPAIRQATAKVLGALNLPPRVARNVVLAKEPFGGGK